MPMRLPSSPHGKSGAAAPDAMSALPALRPLTRAALPLDTVRMARYLVGKYLVHDLPEGRAAGRIVEVEAYPVGDSTSYAYRGPTQANRAMFMARGHAVVWLVYGVAWTLNISAEAEGTGAGVLVRALEPVAGIALMQHRRPGAALRDLARGPGRLGAAMAIGPAQYGADLCAGAGLWLAADGARSRTPVGVATRIGLSRETERPLRFYVPGSPFVSGPRKLLAPAG